jgi:large subunit ribosomal protein L24
MKIKKNDTVLVVAGKDKGKKGKVRQAMPGEQKLLVDGVNMSKKHVKPRPNIKQAGIIDREAPISVSNVMLFCNKCNHPVRIGYRFLADGKKVRICRACQEVID